MKDNNPFSIGDRDVSERFPLCSKHAEKIYSKKIALPIPEKYDIKSHPVTMYNCSIIFPVDLAVEGLGQGHTVVF